MGAFDDLIPGGASANTSAPPSGGLFDDLVPKRGPIGEIAAAAKRGLYTGVKGAGEVLQAPAEMAGEEPGVISRLGQRLEAYGKQGENATPLQPDEHSGVTNFLGKAAASPGEALPLLATTIPAAAAGAGAGSLVAPGPGTVAGAVGGAIAGGVAGGGVTALQTYHEKYHEALDKGLPDDQARAYAKASAVMQGTIMGGVSAVPFAGPVARMAMKAPAESAAKTLADVAGKRFLPEFAKGAGELTAVNTGLGAAGAAGQAEIDQSAGLPTESPGDAALHSIVPSLAASVGFLPLAVHPALAAARASKAIRTPLEDAQAPVSDRLQAALAVHQAIDQVDPDAAKAWDANVSQAIHAGQAVPLDDSIFNGGATTPEGEAAPGEHVPSAVEDEAPISSVNPNLGPLSRAAAMSEQATLPGFPFTSPGAAQKSLEGRGEPPEGWAFQVQRHPSIENRWAVTLRQLTKEESDARPVEGEAGSARGAGDEGAEAADREGAPAGAELSGGTEGGSAPGGEEAPHLDALAHQAATSPLNDREEPTEGQKEAGNYAKGHLKVQGLDISVENPAGSVRSGVGPDGKPWDVVMHDHYGYIRGTVGRDKDHIDAFVGPNPESTRAFVVDQVNPSSGKFDEHKVVLGASSIKEARDIYQRNFEPGWKGLGAIRPTTIDRLKRWFKEGDLNKPFSDAEADDYATGKGEEQGRGLGQRAGTDAGLPAEGAHRNEPAGQQGEGAKAGGGDRSEHREALQAVTDAAQAVRVGNPKAIRDAIKRLDAARLRARNMGAPEEEVRRAAAPEGAEPLRFIDRRDGTFIAMRGEREAARASVEGDQVKGVKVAPGEDEAEAFLRGHIERSLGQPLRAEPQTEPEDFTTRKGEVKTFDNEAKAKAYLGNRTNRVPGNFKPRETPDGWVLSRPERTRSPAQRANDERLARARRTFNPERDPLVTFMGKMGGIRAEDLLTDGVDPADLKDLRSGVVGKPAYRKTGGLSLDGMAELAAAHGFDVLDEAGRPDATKMRDLIEEELSGNHIYTPEGYERLASLEAEDREREERARFENDFDPEALQRSGYDELSPEGQDLVTQAFEDDLDGLVASFEHAGKELTDEEADDLFRRSTDELPEEAQVGAARGADEGARHDQEPALHEAGANGLVGQSARRYGDTETFEVPAAQGSGPGFAIRSPAGQLDLFTSSPVSGERGAPKARAIYATQIAPAKRGEVRVGFDRIDTPERAAHVFAGLRKNPREYFAVLVLGKNDEPIAYLDLFRGAVSQTSVYPQVVSSTVFSIPGAKSIWMAHNHPSGLPEPSIQDMQLTQLLKEHLGPDVGVEYKGHVVIAGNRAQALEGKAFDIPAAARTKAVPIMELAVRKPGKLSLESIMSPQSARRMATSMAELYANGEAGLLLFDTQHRPVAYVPMDIAAQSRLRTGDKDTGLGALVQDFARAGASRAIAYSPKDESGNAGYREGLRNIASALRGLEFKLLDAVGPQEKTFEERGLMPQPESAFYSRSSSGKEESPGEADPYAKYHDETVTEKVALDDGRTATLTHKADVALRDVDERLAALRDLLECLS